MMVNGNLFKVEVMSHYRFNTRSKSYTKIYWEALVKPTLEEAGLTENRRYTDSGVCFWNGIVDEETLKALKTRVDRLCKRVSIGMLLSQQEV